MRFLKIVKFDFISLIKNPLLFFLNTAFPLILVGLIGYVTSGSYNASDISSYDYYGVTMMIYTAVMITMTVANTFMERTVKNGNMRIVFSPVTKMDIYLSKIFATYLFATVSYSLILLIEQYVFCINLGGKNIIYIMVLINLFMLFSCCIGTMLCCLVRSEEVANTVVQPYNQLTAILGGLFFPIAGFGKTMEKISYLSPIKWVTECIFQIIYDNDFRLMFPVIVLLVLGSVFCIIVCQIRFKPEEYI